MTLKVVPAPRTDSTRIWPRWRSTMRRTMDKPSPVPGKAIASGLVQRKNSSNIRSWSAAEIPNPVSVTVKSTPCGL